MILNRQQIKMISEHVKDLLEVRIFPQFLFEDSLKNHNKNRENAIKMSAKIPMSIAYWQLFIYVENHVEEDGPKSFLKIG